jgi:hypothetical protein
VVDVLPFLSVFDPDAVEAGLSGLTGNVQFASSNEKVAGDDARCVSAESNIGGQENLAKWCFATNGLLLSYSSADAAGTYQAMVQATEVGKVSDSDVEPPYPVTEVSESPTPSVTPGG